MLVMDECFNDFIEEPERYTMKNYLKENKNLSTIGLIGGFVLMMILDVALG